MSSNNILNKILNLLAVDKNELVELTRNVVYGSLVPDNEILEVSEWKIGVPVFVISEDGTKKPLEDGDHEVIIEDTADGLSQGGPTKYALKIEGNKIESLQIKQLKEAKAIDKNPNTNLSSMEEKATVPGTETPEKEMMADPLKDLPSEDKYATKAEIEDIKKAIEEIKAAMKSLGGEAESEEMGATEKSVKVPETKTPNKEEMGAVEKTVAVPETKVPGKKVKMSSARSLTGAPEAEKPSFNNFYNKEKSFESTRDRVYRRLFS